MNRLLISACAALSACSTIDHNSAPADWPALEIVQQRVSHAAMRDTCAPFVGAFASPEGCALIYFAESKCVITVSADFPDARVLDHEMEHCRGADHPGESTLRDAWQQHKRAVLARP